MVANVTQDKNGTMISVSLTVKKKKKIANKKRIMSGIVVNAHASVKKFRY